MNSKFSMILVTILSTVSLLGCAADSTTQSGSHRHEPMASQSGMGIGSMGMSGSNMTSMCDMHDSMMSSKSPAERKEIMSAHIKNMSPEMMQRHMELMQSEMQMMREQMGTSAPSK